MELYKFLLAGLVFACTVTSVLVQCDTADTTKQVISARAQFVLPKLFDFTAYKSIFHKNYRTIIDESVRQKLFMGRAFSAFISMIRYKLHKSDFFEKVNEMSDWTISEIKSIMLLPSVLLGQLEKSAAAANKFGRGVDVVDDEEELAPVELEDIEEQLRDIVENHSDEPGYSEIAAELQQSADKKESARDVSRRKKRDAQSGKVQDRNITVDDLTNDTPELEKPLKYSKQILSNNPNYEKLNLSASVGSSNHVGKSPSTAMLKSILKNVGKSKDFVQELVGNVYSSVAKANQDIITHFIRQIDFGDVDEKLLDQDGNVLPDEVFVNLQDQGCLTQPASQEYCGSCFIFSVTALYENAYCRQTGKLIAFSNQYVVDCGGLVGLGGCDGGDEKGVVKFINKYGLELRDNYPYSGEENQCPYAKSTDPEKMGYLRVKSGHLISIHMDRWEDALNEGYPIAVGIFIDIGFLKYGGGVDDGRRCKERYMGHAMTLVGHGREDGHEYWLFRNSFGVRWGHHGHWKLNKRAHCYMSLRGYTSDAVFLGSANDDLRNIKYTGDEVLKRLESYMQNGTSNS